MGCSPNILNLGKKSWVRDNFLFKIKERDLAGRIGVLETRHGRIETPYIFPVIDIVRQEIEVKEIFSLGFNAVITNSYLLKKRGFKGDVHKIFGEVNPVVMTDSGAYQLLEYGEVDVSNKEIIEYQKKINSDIAVILDIPTGDSLDRKFAEWTVSETLRRGKEAKEVIDKERIWVLPIQGGVHLDLVEKSASLSSKLDFPMYALGSPTKLLESYRYDIIVDMIVAARKHIPFIKPLHLFGAGHPMMMVYAVSLGVDFFDSASYILFARDDRYMTENGTIRLSDLYYFPCSCPVCSKYDVQDLKEMNKRERTRLLALHNLYVIRKTMNRIKQAIKEGRLWEVLEEHSRKHPKLLSAYTVLWKKYSRWLEKYTPEANTNWKAPLLFDKTSLKNPKVYRQYRFLNNIYTPLPLYKKLTIKPLTKKTLNDEKLVQENQTHIIYYDPIIGILPIEFLRTYPLGHAVTPGSYDGNSMKKSLIIIEKFLTRNADNYKEIKIELCKDSERLLESKKASFLKNFKLVFVEC